VGGIPLELLDCELRGHGIDDKFLVGKDISMRVSYVKSPWRYNILTRLYDDLGYKYDEKQAPFPQGDLLQRLEHDKFNVGMRVSY